MFVMTEPSVPSGPPLTDVEVPERLRVSPLTVRNWRWLGAGAAYCKVGRAVRYRLADVVAFEEASRVEPAATRAVFKRGQIVRYAEPEAGEKHLTFVVIEDRGDRVLIESRDFPGARFAPQE